MKKRFKSRKKHYILYLIIYLIIIIIGFILSIKLFLKYYNKSISKEEYLNYLINTSFKSQIDYSKLESTKEVSNNTISNEPLIYIYNTHDEEEYNKNIFNVYDINPTVKWASYYLKEKLSSLNITSIVEDRSIKEYLSINNLLYKDSYKVSRIYLEDIKTKYPSITYYIDIHRDSISKELTTTSIDNKSYAKLLFILGLENPNYEYNLLLINKINNNLEASYPTISRGIYKKSGNGVNGIYNQDFSNNCILIEVGGKYNTIEEVSNTIDILSKVLYEELGEI